jgi:hypothetical protein
VQNYKFVNQATSSLQTIYSEARAKSETGRAESEYEWNGGSIWSLVFLVLSLLVIYY